MLTNSVGWVQEREEIRDGEHGSWLAVWCFITYRLYRVMGVWIIYYV